MLILIQTVETAFLCRDSPESGHIGDERNCSYDYPNGWLFHPPLPSPHIVKYVNFTRGAKVHERNMIVGQMEWERSISSNNNLPKWSALKLNAVIL